MRLNRFCIHSFLNIKDEREQCSKPQMCFDDSFSRVIPLSIGDRLIIHEVEMIPTASTLASRRPSLPLSSRSWRTIRMSQTAFPSLERALAGVENRPLLGEHNEYL